jgi:predicted transposase YbfD/YdcC
MECLNEVEDPRQASNGTRHDFQEILVIAICAMLSDSDSVEDFSEWGRLKLDWLRRFLVLKNGIPSQDTFLRVFRALDPKQFEAAFRRWTGGIVGALDGSIAIGGKTLRRSADGNASPVHMVSAFATDLGLALGQEKVSGKSNEITAIPELLEALYIKGLMVSIDAMGCQREIAEKIVHKGGDYLLAVKGNQPTLYQQVRDLISDARGATEGFEHMRHDHGRAVLQLSWEHPQRQGDRHGSVAGLQERWLCGVAAYRWRESRGTRRALLHQLTSAQCRTIGPNGARALGHREQASLDARRL